MKTNREKQLESALALFIKAHDMSPRAEVTVGIDRDIAICTQYLAEAYSAATALVGIPHAEESKRERLVRWQVRQAELRAIGKERKFTKAECDEWDAGFS